MYRIDYLGDAGDPRVTSTACLDADQFAMLALELGVAIVRARKTAPISARRATSPEHIETRWNGKESEADAQAGDWVVTALAADRRRLIDSDGYRNVYVITGDRFFELYAPLEDQAAPTGGDLYRPTSVVEAIRLTGGFEIVAPWGAVQRADDGWLLLRSGRDVYGNHRDTFAATYEIID